MRCFLLWFSPRNLFVLTFFVFIHIWYPGGFLLWFISFSGLVAEERPNTIERERERGNVLYMYVCAHLKVNTCVHQTHLDSWPKCDKMHVSGVPRERNMSILLQHRQHHKSCQKPFSISQLSHLISDVLGKAETFYRRGKKPIELAGICTRRKK